MVGISNCAGTFAFWTKKISAELFGNKPIELIRHHWNTFGFFYDICLCVDWDACPFLFRSAFLLQFQKNWTNNWVAWIIGIYVNVEKTYLPGKKDKETNFPQKQTTSIISSQALMFWMSDSFRRFRWRGSKHVSMHLWVVPGVCLSASPRHCTGVRRNIISSMEDVYNSNFFIVFCRAVPSV